MYVVYLLTNIDKDTQPNKYIGSKSHCKIIDVDGIPTMIDVKTGKPYFGSSTNQEMRDDLKRGDRFSCTVLEEVPWENKKHLREREDFVDVAKRTGLVLESVKRYFLRCVRRRLKSSDL